jgi:hypothetical protein
MVAGRGTEKTQKATNNRRRKLFRHNALLTLVLILINGNGGLLSSSLKTNISSCRHPRKQGSFLSGTPNKLMHLENFGKQITRDDQRDDQGLGTENNSSSALFLTIILVYRTVALRFWSCILLSSLTIL